MLRDVFVDRNYHLGMDLCDFYDEPRVLRISSAEHAVRE